MVLSGRVVWVHIMLFIGGQRLLDVPESVIRDGPEDLLVKSRADCLIVSSSHIRDIVVFLSIFEN